MADVAINAAQVQPTPGGYRIVGGQEIVVRSVRVSYDGTGAGAPFVPVLQLVAPGPTSTIVSEFPLGTQVAAGASADISWFPGVTPQPTAPTPAVTEVDSPHQTITVTNNTGPVVDIDLPNWQNTAAAAYDSLTQADIGSAFDQDGASYFWGLQWGIALGTMPFGTPVFGTFAYEVGVPGNLGAGRISLPFTGTASAITGPLSIFVPNAEAIYGSGQVWQLATGNTVNFALVASSTNQWLMELRIAGTPATFVDATTPFTLAIGDTIAGIFHGPVQAE